MYSGRGGRRQIRGKRALQRKNHFSIWNMAAHLTNKKQSNYNGRQYCGGGTLPMSHPSELIFAAGMARPSSATPIAVQYDLLLVTFTFLRDTGIIQDAEANLVCAVTSEYLRQLLVGRCIYTQLEDILQQLDRTYLGIGGRTLQVCLKDAYDKIQERGGKSPLPSGQSCPHDVKLDKKAVIMYNQNSQNLQLEEEVAVETLPRDALCVVGLSKTGSRNPITKVHQSLMGSFLVDAQSGEIFAAEFNTVCRLTNQFLRSLIVGRNLRTDVDDMVRDVQRRYLGDSRRAIATILRDAQNKLLTHQTGEDSLSPHT